MTTAHMTVLRYASFAVIGVLLVMAVEKRSFPVFMAALVVSWGVIFLLLTPESGTKKRWVVLWSLSPYLLFAVGMSGWSIYSARVIDPAEIELSDLSLSSDRAGLELTGRVRNHSTHPLTAYSLEIMLYDADAIIERTLASVSMSNELPPQEMRDFKQRVQVSSTLPKGFTWQYKIIGTRGR